MADYVPKVDDLVEIAGPVLAIRPKTGTVKEVWHNMRRALVRVHGGTVELLFFTRLSPAKIKEKRVMTLWYSDDPFGVIARRHVEQQHRDRARADLEIEVILRHGWIEKIERISDEGLRILLEEAPRK